MNRLREAKPVFVTLEQAEQLLLDLVNSHLKELGSTVPVTRLRGAFSCDSAFGHTWMYTICGHQFRNKDFTLNARIVEDSERFRRREPRTISSLGILFRECSYIYRMSRHHVRIIEAGVSFKTADELFSELVALYVEAVEEEKKRIEEKQR